MLKRLSLMFILLLSIFLISCVNSKVYRTITIVDDEKVVDTIKVLDSSVLSEPNHNQKEGYTFIGFFENGKLFDFTQKITKDITLEMVYEKNDTKYVVSIYYQDELLEKLEVEPNSNLSTLKPLEKEGYVFKGYYLDGNLYDLNSEVTSDLTLTAVFEIDNTVTVKYYDSNILIKTEKVEKGSSTSFEYSKDGYEFLGWSESLENITEDIDVFVELLAIEYTIEYVNSSNNHGNKKTYTIEDSFILYTDEIEGKVFMGWYNENGDKIDMIEKGTFGNIKIYAKFIDKVTITFDLDGGYFEQSDINEYSITNNKLTIFETNELPKPKKAYHNFVGYKMGEEIVITAPISDSEFITLKAVWEEISDDDYKFILLEEELAKLFSKSLTKDIDITNITKGFDINITSSNESIVSNTLKVTRQFGDDKLVTLKFIATLNDKTKEMSFDCKVSRAYKDISKGGIIAGYNYTSTVPNDTTLEKVDILYCAFGEASANGKLANKDSVGRNVSKYIDKAHSYGDYVILSISTSNLDVMCRNDDLIKSFVEDLIDTINTYKLDGIDIDWERPQVSEKQNYTKLMKELYTKVKANNPEHLVTTATAAGPWQYPSFDLENSIKYIDYINLMAYDLQTNAKSTHHSPLYPSSKGYTLGRCSIDESLPYYNALGVDNSKIILGLPFYGRKFVNTDGIGKASSAGSSITQTQLYNEYLKNPRSDVIIGFDDECKVPYIYDKTERLFISYDNEKSIDIKCEYIKNKGLSGMMYWQNSQDYNNLLLNRIYHNKELMKSGQ